MDETEQVSSLQNNEEKKKKIKEALLTAQAAFIIMYCGTKNIKEHKY